jgi:hypothetical protein
MRGVAVAVAVVLGCGAPAVAETADPYLDAIAPNSEVTVIDPAAMLGAPDGRFATVNGQYFKRLVLDLGAAEDGVGDLEVVYRNPFGTPMQSVFVDFLDNSGRKTAEGHLLMIGSGPRTMVVSNSSTEPYRYLSIVTELQTFTIDSMKTTALATPAVIHHQSGHVLSRCRQFCTTTNTSRLPGPSHAVGAEAG